jgi:sirohydrochlorin ferrochelatase
MTLAGAPLVLAAHGSADPRFADVFASLTVVLAELRPQLDIRVGYLEHGPPELATVASPECVVVPVLLSNGYHVHIDIPTNAAGATIASPIGPDPRLAELMARRLRDAGWRGGPVLLAAAGSADAQALDDARTAAANLSREIGAEVTAAFIGSGEPKLRDLQGAAIATYLVAPGRFADIVSAQAASVVTTPLGADPILAQIILDRYDTAVACARVKVAQPTPAGR